MIFRILILAIVVASAYIVVDGLLRWNYGDYNQMKNTTGNQDKKVLEELLKRIEKLEKKVEELEYKIEELHYIALNDDLD